MKPLGRVLALLVLLAAGAREAAAYVYFTPDALYASFFPSADAGEDVTFTPDAGQRDALKALLGYDLPKPSYTVHVARQGGAVVGYALVDEQNGQHEPITFGVLVAPDGTVKRVEIMVYREPYGDGVRSSAFRAQFTGLAAASPMRAGREINIVSGATISSRALSVGVRRAAAIVSAFEASTGPKG
jgi:hypothetical protein